MNRRYVLPLFLVSVVVLWYGVVWISRLPPTILPPPHIVIVVIGQEWGNLLRNTGVTLGTAILGYIFANILAITFAVAFLYLRWLKALATPWIIVLKNLPVVSVASLLIISLGDSLTPRVLVVILICFHPILANLQKGFEQVDPNLVARFQTLHATRWQLVRYVLWPNALPYYAAAHEIAFTSSIIAAVIGEFFFSRQGLGFMLIQAMTEYRGDRLWATNLIIAALSAGAYVVCRWIERRMVPWRNP